LSHYKNTSLRRTASFDVVSVKSGSADSSVGEFKNQKNVVNFEQMGCMFYLYGKLKPSADFLMVKVYDVITPFKFGDDRFLGFWLAKGQILPFPTDFECRSYNTHTFVTVATKIGRKKFK